MTLSTISWRALDLVVAEKFITSFQENSPDLQSIMDNKNIAILIPGTSNKRNWNNIKESYLYINFISSLIDLILTNFHIQEIQVQLNLVHQNLQINLFVLNSFFPDI